MKKWMVVWIAAAFLFVFAGCGFAEEPSDAGQASEEPVSSAENALNDFADVAKDAWSDITGWAGNTWNNVSSGLDAFWGEASGWINNVWNDSAKWLTDIWGDASAWASDAGENVNAWWNKTFETVTEKVEEGWSWLKDTSKELAEKSREKYEQIREALCSVGDNALDEVKAEFFDLLKPMEISEEDSEKIWSTLMAYADEKGISRLSVAKLALPYLLELSADKSEQDESISAVTIAQYLTGALETLEISNDEGAEKLVKQMNEALDGDIL